MARQMVDAMGGRRSLAQLTCLRWDIAGRSHIWDRATGRYRYETHSGNNLLVVLMNLRTGVGTAYRFSRPLPAGEQQEWLDRARAAHAHDAFWLLSVERLFDDGVTLAYIGDVTIDGASYPTLEASFPQGSAPYARVRYHIDRDRHLPVYWTIFGNGGAGVTFRWTEWQEAHDLRLPVRFEEVDGERTLEIRNLFTPRALLDSIFEVPAAGQAGRFEAPADATESIIELIEELRVPPGRRLRR